MTQSRTRAVHDPRAVADAVADLLADPDRAAEMGRAGREWVRDQWRWPDLADRLRTLLDAS